MPSLNQCMFIGHLGADPEIKFSKNGEPYGHLRVAVSNKYKDVDQPTEWVRGVVFGKRAKFAEDYLHKGDCVYIDGRLQTNKWTDTQGVIRYTAEIIVNNLQGLSPKSAPSNGASAPDYDPDIPF